jgi:hypothetical protein
MRIFACTSATETNTFFPLPASIDVETSGEGRPRVCLRYHRKLHDSHYRRRMSKYYRGGDEI